MPTTDNPRQEHSPGWLWVLERDVAVPLDEEDAPTTTGTSWLIPATAVAAIEIAPERRGEVVSIHILGRKQPIAVCEVRPRSSRGRWESPEIAGCDRDAGRARSTAGVGVTLCFHERSSPDDGAPPQRGVISCLELARAALTVTWKIPPPAATSTSTGWRPGRGSTPTSRAPTGPARSTTGPSGRSRQARPVPGTKPAPPPPARWPKTIPPRQGRAPESPTGWRRPSATSGPSPTPARATRSPSCARSTAGPATSWSRAPPTVRSARRWCRTRASSSRAPHQHPTSPRSPPSSRTWSATPTSCSC